MKSSNLENTYLTNGKDLYLCLAHTESGVRLENCYTNLQTYYRWDEFTPLKLKHVCKRGTDTPKAA